MSSMLEQAIIDADALREVALKNAESAVIEKYSTQIKEAVEEILNTTSLNEEEEEETKHPKIKVTKEGEIEIYENEEEKSDIVIESDEEVDEEYEKIMFESMIKRTVKKVLSK